MNQGPKQKTIDINALPYEVSYEILKHLSFKELVILSSLNGLWYNLVQERYQALIELYFPYLLAQRENEIKTNAFNVFNAEYCRYKKYPFPQIDMSFILEALGGSLNNIKQTTIKNNKITLYGLFMSNGHILPNELLEENKTEIIGHALAFAASNGQLLVVKDLLSQEEIRLIDKGWALILAAERDQLEVVKHLCTLPEITPEDKSEALKEAAEEGQFEVVKHLLTLPEITPQHKGLALYYAAIADRLKMVMHLSTLPEITAMYKNWALKVAAEGGRLEIVKHLSILPDIASNDKGDALVAALKAGHLEVVEHLLTLTLPEITADEKRAALKEAVWQNQLEIVKHISTLPEITADDKTEALKAALRADRLEIVKYLSTLPEITPQTKSQVLRDAISAGRVQIAKHLSTLPEIPPQHKGQALNYAVWNTQLEIVKFLSTLPEITPQHKGQALIEAAWEHRLEIMKYLSTLPEMPLRYKVLALYQAITRGSHEIAKHLLISIVQTAKDNCLTHPKHAITAIQAFLNLPFVHRHKTALSRLMLASMMCFGLTAKFPLISAGRSIFLGYAAGAMLVSMLLSTLYQRYMERTFVNYNTPEKIKTLTDANEKQALKAGVDAKNWWGYAKSFTVYATYRQMSAFNAGKKCALNDASQSLAEIAKLRVS